MNTRILGLDPGLQITGYAVVESSPRGPTICEAGVIKGTDKPAAKPDTPRRLANLYTSLAEILDQFQPAEMAVEQLYSHYAHPRTAVLMGHARGVLLLAAAQREIPVTSYNPTQIKKTITGHGRASKEQMQHAICRELGLAKVPEPPDVADRARRRALSPVFDEEMITRITGHLVRVLDDEVRLAAGSFEYQVLVPEFVRRQLQTRAGNEITLHTTQYLEGNQAASRFIPRLIGFLTERDLAFFDLFCTVDKVGVRKVLKALNRPVSDIADAIHRQDVKWLTTLPGVGPSTAKEMLHTLKDEIGPYVETPMTQAVAVDPAAGRIIEDAYQALVSLGHSPSEARARLDAALEGGRTYSTVEALLTAVYGKR